MTATSLDLQGFFVRATGNSLRRSESSRSTKYIVSTHWGFPKHRQPAFRPAYGKFDSVRLLFPKATTILAFSATLPPHMLQIVKKKLSISPDHFFIRRMSNRPNITYATRKIVGSIGDHRNLQFILPPAQSFNSITFCPKNTAQLVLSDIITAICEDIPRSHIQGLPSWNLLHSAHLLWNGVWDRLQ